MITRGENDECCMHTVIFESYNIHHTTVRAYKVNDVPYTTYALAHILTYHVYESMQQFQRISLRHRAWLYRLYSP